MEFKSVKPEDIHGNAIRMIGHEWMLVSAGTKENFNTMTAAWGSLGFLWNKPVAIIFIRPQRYTYEFTEKYDQFSLSFFGGGQTEALKICGTLSGRDTDKVKEAGLTVRESPSGNIYFEEASLVIECSKAYYHDIDPHGFIDAVVEKVYPSRDYHRMYIGFIRNCMIKA